MPAAVYSIELYGEGEEAYYRLIKHYPGADWRGHVARSHGNSLGDQQDIEMICAMLNEYPHLRRG